MQRIPHSLMTPMLALAAVFLAMPVMAQRSDLAICKPGVDIPNLSVNCPDMYAWQVFAEVVKPVGSAGVPTFQTWSTDPQTFQCPPATKAVCDSNPSAAGCPVWPADPGLAKRAAASPAPPPTTQRSGLAAFQTARPAAVTGHPIGNCWLAENTEIVHRNKVTFDYIVQNGLWYQEGNAQAFLAGLDIEFPIDAIEVKTNWKTLGPADDPSRYLTMTTGSGSTSQVLGLIAMHISTKALPNWFWSTFEHVDNPGRCDFLGCRDSFGFTPAFIPPHQGPQCQQYPVGAPTSGWEKLGLQPVYRNYRLKGSMTDFTTPTGLPVLLGNSVTEATFVQTSSCMTCHSRATVGSNGVNPYPQVAGFTPDDQSYNGTPDPNWYYANLNPTNTWSLQTDFVWAIPFKAFSVSASAACCSSGFPGSTVCQAN